MVDAVISTKYGKRPVLDVPPMKAYGGNVQNGNVQFNNQVSGMMDYNTSSLIQQPQQPVQYVAVHPQTQYATAQPQQVFQPQTVQYPTVQQQVPQQQTYQQPTYQQPTAYNPYAGGYPDQRMAASAPAAPAAPAFPTQDPNSFMSAMMGSMNPFNPVNGLGPPLPGPPPMAYPAPQIPPPPNYPPPGYQGPYHPQSQPAYGAPPHPSYAHPSMNQPVHVDDNYSIQGKLEFGKMTTVHVDSITGNFRQLPEILRKELKRTYGKYPETDIKISVENGEYHIYASPHRDDDRPIRGPRAYDEDDRRSYDHDDYKRQPRINDEFRPKPPKEYDPDFVRARGFEQEPRRRHFPDDRDSDPGEWVLVKRR